jgi:hypothetical protein
MRAIMAAMCGATGPAGALNAWAASGDSAASAIW